MHVEFCGEWSALDPASVFTIGRDGDLQIDDNPYLHRYFLQVGFTDGLWWLSNAGSQLSATVSSGGGAVQAFLAPGARLPLVFAETTVLFTAGPTTYELTLVGNEPTFSPTEVATGSAGETTIGPVMLTTSQKVLIVALAEPMLRREGTGTSAIPSSKQAAARLGWEITRFNRKLDNVCDKLDRRGVRGLRGGPGQLAVNRRARLVEHAVASRLVTPGDLALLEAQW